MAMKSAGTRLLISPAPGAPPTLDIDGLTDIGELGVERKAVDTTAIDDEWISTEKGRKDTGKLPLSGLYEPRDRGQAVLAEAVIADDPYNFRAQLPDGSTFEFAARVMSYKPGAFKVEGAIGFKAELSGFGAIVMAMPALSVSRNVWAWPDGRILLWGDGRYMTF